MNQNRSRQVRLGQFVLSALVTLSLVACGGGGGSTKPDASAATDAPSASNPPVAAPPSSQDPAPEEIPNNPPHIDGDLILTARAGTAYSFKPTFGDDDENDFLTLNIVGKPDWLSFDAKTGALTGTPLEGNVGQSDDITITVSDGKATQPLGPFRITVVSASEPAQPTNQPPVITGSPSTLTTALQPYIFLPKATDAENDKITWAVTNLPAWAQFSTSTGQISGTPPRSQAKTFANIRIRASDGKASTELAFDLVVQPAPLVITNIPATSVTAGTSYSYTPVIDKLDGVKLTWSIANKPAWAAFSTSTGALTGTPTTAQIGSTTGVKISATDGRVTGSTNSFSVVVVAAPNSAPTITGTPATTVQVGQTYSFKPVGKDADTADTLSYSITNKPSWATFSIATGELSGSPTADDARTYSGIVITVKDGKSSASLASFSITVTAPPVQTGSAKLTWTAPTQNTDGTQLTTLAGFKIYYGLSASDLDQVIDVGNPQATSYTVNGLTQATWYFSVRSYSSTGVESQDSNVASKTIN